MINITNGPDLCSIMRSDKNHFILNYNIIPDFESIFLYYHRNQTEIILMKTRHDILPIMNRIMT